MDFTCPKCKRYNALLIDPNGGPEDLECRDCGHKTNCNELEARGDD